MCLTIIVCRGGVLEDVLKGKKRIFAEIQSFFSAKIRNSNSFSGRKQVISKKKKKGLCRNSKGFFGQNQKFEEFFWPETGDLQKKKKRKDLHRLYVSSEPKIFTILVQTKASPSQLRLPNPFGGAVFIFGANIGLKSTKKCYFAYFSGPLATLLLEDTF